MTTSLFSQVSFDRIQNSQDFSRSVLKNAATRVSGPVEEDPSEAGDRGNVILGTLC